MRASSLNTFTKISSEVHSFLHWIPSLQNTAEARMSALHCAVSPFPGRPETDHPSSPIHHHCLLSFCSDPSQSLFWFSSWMKQLSMDCRPFAASVAKVNMWFLVLNRVSLDPEMGTMHGPPPRWKFAQGSTEQHQMSWCFPCVPTTKTLLQSIWEATLSFLISNLVTGQKLGNVKTWISQIRTCNCHGCSCRVVPTTSLSQSCCHCKGHITDFLIMGGRINESARASDDWWMLPIITKERQVLLRVFWYVRDESWDSLLCIIKSPFQIEKITNLRIAIFSFQATIFWVSSPHREACKHLTTSCYKEVKLKSVNSFVWQSWH